MGIGVQVNINTILEIEIIMKQIEIIWLQLYEQYLN